MKRKITWFLLCFFLVAGGHLANCAEIDLKIDFRGFNNNILAVVNFAIPAQYHAYAHAAGYAGKPAEFQFSLAGLGGMPIIYPDGAEENDIYEQTKKIMAWRNDIALLAVLPTNSKGMPYNAVLDMLLCSKTHCLPYKREISGVVPDTVPPLAKDAWPELLAKLRSEAATLSLEKGTPPPPLLIPAENLPDPVRASEGKELAAAEDFDLKLIPDYAQPDLEIFSLGKALALGLLAGLILNAMPCVLPVLALKVNSLLHGGGRSRKRIKLFRTHNLFFAAGILSLFTLLALLLSALDMMWGQLYQNHAILLILLFLVFFMGLSMLGVFTLPSFDLRLGSKSRNSAFQSYCSGLLCTFLATPCSGPLLGGVLAWAFTQPPLVLLLVFWAVGLGMSLPYLALCIWPNVARLLPRPGNWMYIFEHILGFMLLGTSLYLLSIIPENKLIPTLSMLLALSVLVWLWGRFCGLNAPLWLRRTGGLAVIALMCASISWLLQPPEPEPNWHSFNPELFAQKLGKKNLLVEFTASWCPNCKYLEATVLTEKNLTELQKRYDVELIKVDLTSPSPYAEKLLAMLGGKSIPLTAMFPRGQKADRPLAIRDIYDSRTLESSARQVFQ